MIYHRSGKPLSHCVFAIICLGFGMGELLDPARAAAAQSDDLGVHGKFTFDSPARSMTDPSVPAYVPTNGTPGRFPSALSMNSALSIGKQHYLV